MNTLSLVFVVGVLDVFSMRWHQAGRCFLVPLLTTS